VYLASSSAIGLDDLLIKNPALANQPDVAAKILVSALKTKEQQIRAALSDRNFLRARRLMNGGSNGLAEFTEVFKAGQSLLP
jgi:predicted chitinase